MTTIETFQMPALIMLSLPLLAMKSRNMNFISNCGLNK